MISFRHRHRFCGSCGAPTAPQQNGRVMVCQRKGCDTESFPRVDPAIIVLVTDGDRALLGRQPDWPAGRYSTIAGFVEPGESLEDAVRREVLEETGIETGAMIYQSSQPWPFPRSLMLGFRAAGADDRDPARRPRTRGRALVPSRRARGRIDDAVLAVDRVPPDPGMAEPLSILLSVATGLALAAAAGFRAFVPLLAAGLAIHFGYVEPARGFDWLGEPIVLVALSIATVTEIAAYYVPGVDHALDLIGAPVAVAAGIVAAAGVMVGLPDWLRWLTAIGAGGAVATAGHALNAIGRAKTGAVSGGLGNPVYSTAELARFGRCSRSSRSCCRRRARCDRSRSEPGRCNAGAGAGSDFSWLRSHPCRPVPGDACRAAQRSPRCRHSARTRTKTSGSKSTFEGVEGPLLENVRALSSLHRLAASKDLDAEMVGRLAQRAPDEARTALRPFGYYEPDVTTEFAEVGGSLACQGEDQAGYARHARRSSRSRSPAAAGRAVPARRPRATRRFAPGSG